VLSKAPTSIFQKKKKNIVITFIAPNLTDRIDSLPFCLGLLSPFAMIYFIQKTLPPT
jgi:hypothetical protein